VSDVGKTNNGSLAAAVVLSVNGNDMLPHTHAHVDVIYIVSATARCC